MTTRKRDLAKWSTDAVSAGRADPVTSARGAAWLTGLCRRTWPAASARGRGPGIATRGPRWSPSRWGLLADGRLRLRAHTTMPMHQAAQAHRQRETGTVHQRIILTLP